MSDFKNLYMRQHSNVARKWSKDSLNSRLFMQEDPVFEFQSDHRKSVCVVLCRIKQRLLQQAWSMWCVKSGVIHGYSSDIRTILSRKIPDFQQRSELEIEVLHKWILEVHDHDPTGIANTLFHCKKKSAVYNALQQLRLEFFEPGETILFQGDFPRSEDGHFTVLSGECEVLQFPDESVPQLKLLYLSKQKKFDEAKKLLNSARILAKITELSGFGELATLTGVKRLASIRASRTAQTDILVLPKQPLLDCLQAKGDVAGSVDGAAPSEAIDFMRQSGLANRISTKELILAAGSMIRRTLVQGDILYIKGEPVRSVYLVVSGEFILDTGDVVRDGKLEPFRNPLVENCYHLSSGSILGDEGITGLYNQFDSTAVVISEAAVVFETIGFGTTFLEEKIKSLRYCALAYKDRSRWTPPLTLAEQMNPYTYFNSLRKCISSAQPFRGTVNTTQSQQLKHPEIMIAKVLDTKKVSGKTYNGDFDDEASAKTTYIYPYGVPSKQLKGVDLHHAIEINKIAKDAVKTFMKKFAQENILLDQLLKMPASAKPLNENDHTYITEESFRKALADYKMRTLLKAKDQEEVEEKTHRHDHAVQVIKFFALDGSEDGVVNKPNSNHNNSNHNKNSSHNFSYHSNHNYFSTHSNTSPTSTADHVNTAEGVAEKDMPVGDTVPSVFNDVINESAAEKEVKFAVDAEKMLDKYDDALLKKPKIKQYFIWLDTALNRPKFHLLLKETNDLKSVGLSKPPDSLPGSKTASPVQPGAGSGSPTAGGLAALQFADIQKTITSNEKALKKFIEKFRKFGLTPNDLKLSTTTVAGRPNLNGITGMPNTSINGNLTEDSSNPIRLDSESSVYLPQLVPSSTVPVLNTAALVKFNEMNRKMSKSFSSNKLSPSNLKAMNDDVEEEKKERKTYDPFSWRQSIAHKKTSKKVSNFTDTVDKFSRVGVSVHRKVWDLYSAAMDTSRSREQDYFSDDGDNDQDNNSAASTLRNISFLNDDIVVQIGDQTTKESSEWDVLQDPHRFMEVIRSVDYAARRDRSADYDWSTRFLRANTATEQGEKATLKHAKMVSVKEDDTEDNVSTTGNLIHTSMGKSSSNYFPAISRSTSSTVDSELLSPQKSALDSYNNYMNSELRGKKYYEGKKKGNSNSKFRLPPNHEDEEIMEKMLRQDQKELRNLTNKTSDAAFIGSILMYGNNLQDHEKSKIEDRLRMIAMRQTKSKQQLDAENVSVDSYVTYQSGTVDVPVDPLLTASDDVEMLQHALESRPDTHGHSRASVSLDTVSSATSHSKMDAEMEDWQKYTLEQIFKEKRGAKKTLPVLNMQSRFAAVISAKAQKTYSGGKSRKGSSGGVVLLESEAYASEPTLPSSYLEVYKKTFKIHQSNKDRTKVANDLKAVANNNNRASSSASFDKKVF